MSRWSDYGFPITETAPVSLLLRGLYLALRERYACVGDLRNFTELDMVTLSKMAAEIDYSLNRIGPRSSRGSHVADYFYSAPDFLRITDFHGLDMLASYLGEEVIPPVGSTTSPVTPDWCMQRYRMINLIYNLVSISRVNFDRTRMRYLYVAGVYPNFDYDEVDDVANNNGVWGYWSGWASYYEPYFSPHLMWPVSVINQIPSPADIITYFTMNKVSDEYSAFGTGYLEGETYLYKARSTGTVGEELPTMGASDYATAKATFPSVPPERGFYTTPIQPMEQGIAYPVYRIYDLRPSLEFYDPMEGA